MTYFLITGLLSIPVVVFGWDQNRRRKAMKRILASLQQLEKRYENLRNQHMAIAMTSDGQEIEKMKGFIEKVLLIMKPEMDAFINEAMLLEGSGIHLQSPNSLFPNVVSLVNKYIVRRNRVSPKERSKASEEFHLEASAAFKDSISADIENRILNWEAGNPIG
ncbi:MAG: hypothetical protein MRZ79_22930 [Bacteroidia bacterium]|nr:hypothetical protein [Bacteroidia bacterium]